MGTKLRVGPFNKEYRFRTCRSGKGMARCELCKHCVGGDCIHPDRAKRVVLSAPKEWGNKKGPRVDLAPLRVCDKIEISLSMGHYIPEMELSQTVICADMLHSNPGCPYIVATMIDRMANFSGNNFIRLVEWGSETAGSWLQCELCGKALNLKSHLRDEYLSRQGFEDGYTLPDPEPPLPIVPLDKDNEPIPSIGGIVMSLNGLNGPPRVSIHWTEETFAVAVRSVKHWMNPDPESSCNVKVLKWDDMKTALNLLGWTEVVHQISYEIAVQWGIVYCIHCSIKDRIYGPVEHTRYHDYPVCKTCNSKLVGWREHMDAMPE